MRRDYSRSYNRRTRTAVRSLITLEVFEQHPHKVIATIGAVFVLAYLLAALAFPRAHGRIVNGDAIQYYSYLRSLAIDWDVDFSNEYAELYLPTGDDGAPNVWLTRKTPTGRPANMMSIGPGLLWSPFFAAAYLLAILVRAVGINMPLDGYSLPFVLSAGVAGVVYATLGAHFCYRSCRLVFDSRPAFWATITAWLATPAVYYSVISPAYSHAPSFFAMSLFVCIWLETRHRDDVARYVALGLLAGLATLVRWQDAIILILPGFQLAAAIATRRLSLSAAVPRGIVLAAGVAVMLLPQFLAWGAIYGEFFVLPQGEGFMRWTDPAIAAVLFSLRHGLFSWTPAVLLSIAGLAWLVRRDALLGWASVAVLVVAVYVNASVSDWWAGAAFGARRFVGYTVFFALGFAAAFSSDTWRRPVWLARVVAAVLVLYNLLFVLQYQVFMRGFVGLVPYPSTATQVFVDRLVLPWQILRAWLDGS